MGKSINILDKNYLKWVDELCNRYHKSQINAALSRDLKHKMPDAEGLSETSLRYAKRFYCLYAPFAAKHQHPQEVQKGKNLPQAVEDLYDALFSIPWGHHRYIIDRCANNAEKALFFVHQTIKNGWSRAILLNFLDTDLYERSGKALTNFKNTLPEM